jgi:transposase-like protein
VGVRTPELLHEALALVQQHGGNTSAAARAAGLPRGTLLNRIRAAEASGVTLPTPKPFEVEELPDELPTAEELLAYRTKAFARKARAKEARALIQVTVKIDGPYGIAHFGDPHVDDDGTDLGLLQRHVDVVNRTEGLFAANVGDYTPLWPAVHER